MNTATNPRRNPSLIIQISILSFHVNGRGVTSLISPDMSMRVSGGHLDLSFPERLLVTDADLANPCPDILVLRYVQQSQSMNGGREGRLEARHFRASLNRANADQKW